MLTGSGRAGNLQKCTMNVPSEKKVLNQTAFFEKLLLKLINTRGTQSHLHITGSSLTRTGQTQHNCDQWDGERVLTVVGQMKDFKYSG